MYFEVVLLIVWMIFLHEFRTERFQKHFEMIGKGISRFSKQILYFKR